MTFTGNGVKDDILFDFQDAVQTVFRTQFVGIKNLTTGDSRFLKYKADGTLGLAPLDLD